MEDFAGVLRGTIIEAVVERPGNHRLPEVADGAVGLAGALEPRGEALAIAGWIAAQEARQPGCNGGLVSQTKHGSAQEADGLVRGRGQMAGTDPTESTTWLQNTKLAVPADGPRCFRLVDEVDEVGAAAQNDVLRVDGLAQRGMAVGVGPSAGNGAALQKSDRCSIAGQGDGGGEPSRSRAHHHDVRGAGIGGPAAQIGGAPHGSTRFPVAKFWVAKFQAAIAAPRAMTASFPAVESATRSAKTSIRRSAMRRSRR